MTFSTDEQFALALAPKLTGWLSMIGSFWIIVEVLTEPTKRQNVYHRLILGLSLVDFCSSLAMLLSTWPVPVGTEGVLWDSGNEHTCTIQGFLIQLGIASPVYNVMLAIYYQLIIQHHWTETQLQSRIEPVMHLIAACFAFGPSVSGILLDLYHPATVWCWIARNPDDGASNNHFDWYRWAFYYAVLWSCLVISFTCLASVFVAVRYREQENKPSDDDTVSSAVSRSNSQRSFMNESFIVSDPRHSRRTSTQGSGFSLMGNSRTGRNTSSGGSWVGHQSRRSSLALADVFREPPIPRPQPMRGDSARGHHSRISSMSSCGFFGEQNPETSSARDRRSSIGHHRRPSSIMYRRGSLHLVKNSASESQIEEVIRAIAKIKSSSQLTNAANCLASQNVFEQAIWYTMAFLATYTFATINRVVEQLTGQKLFVLMFLHVFSIPLHGAFNCAIYRRNAYHRLRQRQPHLTSWQTLFCVFRWSFLGPPESEEGVEDPIVSRQGADLPRGNELGNSQVNPALDQGESEAEYWPAEGADFSPDVADVLDDIMTEYSNYPDLLTTGSSPQTSFPTIIMDDSYPEEEKNFACDTWRLGAS